MSAPSQAMMAFQREKDSPVVQQLVSYITETLHRPLNDVVKWEIEEHYTNSRYPYAHSRHARIARPGYALIEFSVDFIDEQHAEGSFVWDKLKNTFTLYTSGAIKG